MIWMTYINCVLFKRILLVEEQKNNAVAVLSSVRSGLFGEVVTSGCLNLQHQMQTVVSFPPRNEASDPLIKEAGDGGVKSNSGRFGEEHLVPGGHRNPIFWSSSA
jgi:hypothetical protein